MCVGDKLEARGTDVLLENFSSRYVQIGKLELDVFTVLSV